MTRDKSKSSIPSGVLGDMGVALARFRCGQMRLIFREKPSQDHGIDAEIEILDGERATGRLLSAQIKCGPSHFRESTDHSITFRFEERHYRYWMSHSLPVIGILVDHQKEVCYWSPLTSDTIESTGSGYKVEVPRAQILNLDSRVQLVDLATPIISSTTYELVDEEDVSTAGARRISHYVRLNASERAWTRHSVRQLILQVASLARTSRYFRNEHTEAAHQNKAAQVVWVYVYQSDKHRVLGAYIARALWVDPQLPGELRPIGFDGETDPSGMTIDWNDNFQELVSLIDAARASKAEYLSFLKTRLYVAESFILKYQRQIQFDNGADIQEFLIDAPSVLSAWEQHPMPPIQCDRLGDRVEDMIALIDNARLFADRLAKDNTRPTRIQFERYLEDAAKRLTQIQYEMSLVT